MKAQPKIVDMPIRGPGKRAWKAAEQTDLLSGWLLQARPPDTDIRVALRPLRARSREQAQNNGLFQSFLRELKTNVLGHQGIVLQGRAKFANGKPKKAINDALEAAWKAWGRRGVCEVTGLHSMVDVANLALEAAARDGEFLLRVVAPWDNDFGVALQSIDVEAVDVLHNEELPNGNRVVMGVELDPWRRPVAYHLTEEPTNSWAGSYQQAVKRTPVPASEIIHGFLPQWVWQTRGVPWASPSLWRLAMVGGYEEAAVTASRGAASKMAFYEHVGDGPVGLTGERTADGDLVREASPGSMEELPPGYTVRQIDWGWPNADHQQFIRPILKSLAAGLGVSYPTWAQDLEGVNYSSLRHGALTERDHWRALQRWFRDWFYQRVFDAWLPRAVMMGAITVAGSPARTPSTFTAGWLPRGWQWVDPEKEGKAADGGISRRDRSISSIIRERGDEPDEVWSELADDIARLEELGLSVVLGSPGGNSGTGNQGGEDA